MGRLENKTCLVTAAGQGIGRASALAMHKEGAKVYATDINEQALSELSEQGLSTFVLDVRNPASINSSTKITGPLDVLFNCAGFVENGTILDCTEEAWAFSLDLNVTAMYRMLKSHLPAMLDNGGGSIINMASVASSIIGAPNRFVYGTTKAAVIGMTKSIAADFIDRNIRCNAICPGTVDSPSLHERMRMSGDYETALAAFTARQPTGRLGKAEEIAALVVYLASDESAFTTGTTHIVDGGWTNT